MDAGGFVEAIGSTIGGDVSECFIRFVSQRLTLNRYGSERTPHHSSTPAVLCQDSG